MSKSTDERWSPTNLSHATKMICTGYPKDVSDDEIIQWFDKTGVVDANLLSQLLSKEFIVLDFGGGIGRVAKHISELVKEIVVCDISNKMLELGKNEWCRGIDNIKWVHNDKGDIPFPNNTFDVVYSFLCLCHLFFESNDAMYWFGEMKRVLKPGGLLCFDTHYPRDIDSGMTQVDRFNKSSTYPEGALGHIYILRKDNESP